MFRGHMILRGKILRINIDIGRMKVSMLLENAKILKHTMAYIIRMKRLGHACHVILKFSHCRYQRIMVLDGVGCRLSCWNSCLRMNRILNILISIRIQSQFPDRLPDVYLPEPHSDKPHHIVFRFPANDISGILSAYHIE